MVATGAGLCNVLASDGEPELRRSLRDLVALSSLPAIWIRANAREVANSLAQLVVSLVDADFAIVVLANPATEIVQCHHRTSGIRPPDLARHAERHQRNVAFVTEEPAYGRLHAFSVPIGRERESSLTLFCRRKGFPTETEQMLLRVAANQAAVAIQRWRSEASLMEQTRELQRLHATGAALYLFTDRLYRAQSLAEIYQAALDAIVDGLGCTRASILLSDEAGVMRFVAWRGLSDEYRKAVDGHSPWARDDRDPQPIFIGDIDDIEVDAALKRTIQAEGIRALAFIPLIAKGALIGKFMTYYDSRHAFGDREVDLAITIARQLGFSIERSRAETARQRMEGELRKSEASQRERAAELQAMMEAVPAVIWIARDPHCRVITGNLASYEFLRLPPGTNPSLSAPEAERPKHFEVLNEGRVLAPEDLPVQRAAHGEEVRNFESEVRFSDGKSGYLFGNATPLRNSEGNLCGALAAFVDITERKKAEEERALMVAELSHRVKNTLATVISIARQSFTRNRDNEEARRLFDARIRALAQTHSRLADANWSGVSLETLLHDELAPYRQTGKPNVRISGPEVVLGARCALTLGMAVHELATNAAKYGALSKENGSVKVGWKTDTLVGRLRISWVEADGPPVAPPARSGFGRLLLERAIAADLKGAVQLDFEKGGLRCEITLPVDDLIARAC
jgi:two-component sensor histidine kinase